MSPPDSLLRAPISSVRSPRATRELAHSAVGNVLEKTTFGRSFMKDA